MQKIIDCPLFNFFSSNGVFRILNFCTISRITSVSKISFKYDVMLFSSEYTYAPDIPPIFLYCVYASYESFNFENFNFFHFFEISYL
mgnify:FL=1